MNYPQEMLDAPRWLLYKLVDGKRKVPYQANGQRASSTDPATWCSYKDAVAGLETGKFAGLGFALGDGFSAIDLDNCIDDKGQTESWALDYLRAVDTTWEVSQSGKGIHLFYKGDCGSSYKDDGVEIYGHSRFFALGTLRNSCPLAEFPEQFKRSKPDESSPEPADAPNPTEYDVSRCRDWVMSMAESVEGERGHDKIFAVVCEIARHNLNYEDSLALLREYNAERCYPPWSEHELRRKIREGRERVIREGELGCRLLATEFDELPIEMDDGPPRIIAFKDLRQYAGSLIWLVEDVFVTGQFAGIVGSFKTLKTSLSLDLAASLAAGVPFLNKFNVPERKRVLVYSGEIGLPVALIKLDAILGSKSLQLDEVAGAWLCPLVPLLRSPDQRKLLSKDIESHGAEVVILDPWFAAAGGADASQLLAISELISQALSVCNRQWCQLIINHHSHRQIPEGEPISLRHISGAGVAENLRQWLLINHAAPYAHGVADLFLSVGGSAGQQGEYRVRIDEGLDDGVITDGRQWKLSFVDPEVNDKVSETVLKIIGAGQSDVDSIAVLAGLTKKEAGKIVGDLVVSGVLTYNGNDIVKTNELERLLS